MNKPRVVKAELFLIIFNASKRESVHARFDSRQVCDQRHTHVCRSLSGLADSSVKASLAIRGQQLE